MRPHTKTTRYRLDRWFQRFEEAWNVIISTSLTVARKTDTISAVPGRFSDLYSRAVDRYLARTGMMEREENVWGQAHFFGLRALGSPEPSSDTAWDLAVDFPLDVGFDYQDELIEYVCGAFASADASEELLLASERALSLLKLWDVGMNPWLLSRVAPHCGINIFTAFAKHSCPDHEERRRVMTIGVEHCLEIFDIGVEACEAWKQMHEDEEKAVASRNGELSAHLARIEKFQGFLFILESQRRLNESQQNAQDQASWQDRFETSDLACIPRDGLAFMESAEVERLAPPLDQFLHDEISRSNQDISELADSIREGDKVPTVADLHFILRNFEYNKHLRDELFGDWLFRLNEQDRASVAEWAARRTLENYIEQMVPILGERIPSDGFEMAELEIVERRSADISNTSVRYDQLVERLMQEKEGTVSRLAELAGQRE